MDILGHFPKSTGEPNRSKYGSQSTAILLCESHHCWQVIIRMLKFQEMLDCRVVAASSRSERLASTVRFLAMCKQCARVRRLASRHLVACCPSDNKVLAAGQQCTGTAELQTTTVGFILSAMPVHHRQRWGVCCISASCCYLLLNELGCPFVFCCHLAEFS